MKKFGLLLLSIFGILFTGSTFANPIAPETHYACSKLKNVEIDNYRVVVGNGTDYYELQPGECARCGNFGFARSGPSSRVFLVDKSIDIDLVNEKSINDYSILLGDIITTTCEHPYDEERIYDIIKDGDTYELELKRTRNVKIAVEMMSQKQNFFLFRALTIIIETLVLFFISKIFRKDSQISNGKLILFGIIPTTVTLPLLRFVLPLIIGDFMRYVIMGETLVVVIETLIIKYGLNISRKRAIVASIICNIFSFLFLSSTELRHVGIVSIFLIFLEMVALLIVRKFILKEYEISNQKLIITGVVASLGSILLAISIALLVIEYLFDYVSSSVEDGLVTSIIIGIKVISEYLIIKYLFNISRKKAILPVVICNLLLAAVVFIFILLDL